MDLTHRTHVWVICNRCQVMFRLHVGLWSNNHQVRCTYCRPSDTRTPYLDPGKGYVHKLTYQDEIEAAFLLGGWNAVRALIPQAHMSALGQTGESW
jgi:hypothetical protein